MAVKVISFILFLPVSAYGFLLRARVHLPLGLPWSLISVVSNGRPIQTLSSSIRAIVSLLLPFF
jgi:hypothetical protein